jgi:hypothetical protein
LNKTKPLKLLKISGAFSFLSFLSFLSFHLGHFRAENAVLGPHQAAVAETRRSRSFVFVACYDFFPYRCFNPAMGTGSDEC